MNLTQTYLTKLKAAQGIDSDRQAAIRLGITKQAVSQYQHGKRQMDIETACKLADLIGENPEKVVAEIQADGAKSPETRQFWTRILDISKAAPALALLGVVAILPTVDGVSFLI